VRVDVLKCIQVHELEQIAIIATCTVRTIKKVLLQFAISCKTIKLLFSIFIHNSQQKWKWFATHAVLVLPGTTKICMQGNESHRKVTCWAIFIGHCELYGYCQAKVSCTENLYFFRTAIIAWRIMKRSIKEYWIKEQKWRKEERKN
jgi:hypothetical protein